MYLCVFSPHSLEIKHLSSGKKIGEEKSLRQEFIYTKGDEKGKPGLTTYVTRIYGTWTHTAYALLESRRGGQYPQGLLL